MCVCVYVLGRGKGVMTPSHDAKAADTELEWLRLCHTFHSAHRQHHYLQQIMALITLATCYSFRMPCFIFLKIHHRTCILEGWTFKAALAFLVKSLWKKLGNPEFFSYGSILRPAPVYTCIVSSLN